MIQVNSELHRWWSLCLDFLIYSIGLSMYIMVLDYFNYRDSADLLYSVGLLALSFHWFLAIFVCFFSRRILVLASLVPEKILLAFLIGIIKD